MCKSCKSCYLILQNTSTESQSSLQNKALLKNISKDLLNKILETVVEPR